MGPFRPFEGGPLSTLSALSRCAFALAFASLMTLAVASHAYAAGDDKDVPRLVSFGGSCAHCAAGAELHVARGVLEPDGE